ncbi:hypothetical protein TanjilG_01293 [Lupinus angustifolius]|uniref:FAS1 domain-containing protein n=1 Tax=Lupinus angustifolius TaxID=3871 RepID=A0A4P1REC4_LUPAN|nr:PREDICTED: fasciclin-like arabinogalactan protein 14 [Lupinus angustifolius]OIW09322.1 hypothetical protein TanjilG_01293 [Lupinus angustifolius]
MSVSLFSSLFCTLLLSFSLLLMFPCVTCFDITKLLSQFPTYSTFSNYLTQTNLATDINNRNSITILAVDNSGMAPVSGKSMNVIKNVLSLHVILDYFDVQKLQHLQNQSVTVRTLFDTSGQAHGLQGFVKITDLSTGAVSFASAFDTNDSIGCNLIKSLVSQPYNISVVHVSTVIMPPFLLSNSNNAPALAPAPITVTVPVPMPVASEPIVSVTPVPMPVLTPMLVPAPVPVVTPVLVPVPVPVPVTISVPVVSPVPVSVPVLAPVPVASPVAVTTPSAGPADAAAAADAPSKKGAGIPKCGGVNRALTTLLTLFSMYLLCIGSIYNTAS